MRKSTKSTLISTIMVAIFSTFAACSSSQSTLAESISENENIEILVTLDKQMPAPFDESFDSGSDANAAFYQPCNRILDNIPVELLRLRDENEVNDWINSFSSITHAPSSISEYLNIYSFVTSFNISKDEAETALVYYLNSDDDMIRMSRENFDIIFSGDIELITKAFASEYSIAVGEFVYCPNWVYTHSSDDYENAGITIEAIETRVDLYSEIYFTNESRIAFSDKLTDYTGATINLDKPIFANKFTVEGASEIIEDTLIVDYETYVEIEEEVKE